MAYEMAHKIANTGWLQIVFAGLLITGIALFHQTLHQVIVVLITLMSALLLAVRCRSFFPMPAGRRRYRSGGGMNKLHL